VLWSPGLEHELIGRMCYGQASKKKIVRMKEQPCVAHRLWLHGERKNQMRRARCCVIRHSCVAWKFDSEGQMTRKAAAGGSEPDNAGHPVDGSLSIKSSCLCISDK